MNIAIVHPIPIVPRPKPDPNVPIVMGGPDCIVPPWLDPCPCPPKRPSNG